jgi:hypothetical protein
MIAPARYGDVVAGEGTRACLERGANVRPALPAQPLVGHRVEYDLGSHAVNPAPGRGPPQYSNPCKVRHPGNWNGERPLDANAPQLHGTGEIKLESADRASGYWITRADSDPTLNARTSGVYWHADPDDVGILDGRDDKKRAAGAVEVAQECVIVNVADLR